MYYTLVVLYLNVTFFSHWHKIGAYLSCQKTIIFYLTEFKSMDKADLYHCSFDMCSKIPLMEISVERRLYLVWRGMSKVML